MNDLWLRLMRVFIEPPRERLAAPVAPVSTAPVAAAIAAPADLWPAASLVGAGLRARCAARAVVVCAWTPGGFDPVELSPPLALPVARRLAARLCARGHDALACGAVCRVRLPADPGEALAKSAAVIGATDEPIVVALGLHHPAFADLLAGLDEVFLLPGCEADAALLELAAAARPAAHIVPLPRSALARHRASLGFGPRGSHMDTPVRLEGVYAPPRPPILERR